MPTIDHITNLLAQFRRYTGSGNMIRANQIMASIIEAMLSLIQTNDTGDQNEPVAEDKPAAEPQIPDTAIMPDSPIVDAEQAPEPVPDEEGIFPLIEDPAPSAISEEPAIPPPDEPPETTSQSIEDQPKSIAPKPRKPKHHDI